MWPILRKERKIVYYKYIIFNNYNGSTQTRGNFKIDHSTLPLGNEGGPKKIFSTQIYKPKALIPCRREMEGIQRKKFFSLILFCTKTDIYIYIYIYIYIQKILAPKLGTFLSQLQHIPLIIGLSNSLYKITTFLIPFFHNKKCWKFH